MAPLRKEQDATRLFLCLCIDKRSTAIVAFFVVQWPHLAQPTGFGNHLFLDELECRGSDFVCRMFGMMVLGSLRIAHAATMNKYVFEPITPAPLIDNDSNIERLQPVERATGVGADIRTRSQQSCHARCWQREMLPQ
jgi:hypothetical protein